MVAHSTMSPGLHRYESQEDGHEHGPAEFVIDEKAVVEERMEFIEDESQHLSVQEVAENLGIDL